LKARLVSILEETLNVISWFLIFFLFQMGSTCGRYATAPDVQAVRVAPALTCEVTNVREARLGGRDEITGAKANAGGFKPWSRLSSGDGSDGGGGGSSAVGSSLRFVAGPGGIEVGLYKLDSVYPSLSLKAPGFTAL
jgi:uncharacterized membrane protein YgcG